MDKEELQNRTKRFAIEIVKFTDRLPHTRSAGVIGRQLIRSATAVGANYRSALRAKSPADFIAKLSIVLEEADESLYWLEILSESDPVLQNLAVHCLKKPGN